MNDADLRDATPPWYVPANHPPNLQKIIVPRGGTLNFEYPVSNGRPTEDTGNLLRRMIESYSVGSHPEFQVLHRKMPVGALHVTEWHVVPTKVLDKDGNMSPADPILETVIAIPPEKRTDLEMVGAICQELSRVTRKRVVVGVVPLNPLMHNARERSARAQPARDILADTLNGVMPGFSWDLYYDPSGFYALNVHWIEVHVTPPVPRRQPQ